MKRIKFEGETYEWSAELCEDGREFVVMLDLGNGRPECIGYAASLEEAREKVLDELETLSA